MGTVSIESELKERLLKEHIPIVQASLKEFPSKGFMSRIFSARSDRGAIIIHVSSPVDEQLLQRNPEKMRLVGKVLEQYSEIPSARVYAAGQLSGGRTFTVQSLIEGSPLGDRVLEGNRIVDRVLYQKKDLLPDLLRILARIHSVRVRRFGYFDLGKHGLVGQYPSWKAFLKTESDRWIRVLMNHADANGLLFFEKVKTLVSSLLKKYGAQLSIDSPRLIHGDMVNPGNVMVCEEHISGIIDFEWAIAGDPAWEFAFTDTVPLRAYFDERNAQEGIVIDETGFLLRIRIYSIFWLLWGLQVHAKGGPIKEVLLHMLEERLAQFDQEFS